MNNHNLFYEIRGETVRRNLVTITLWVKGSRYKSLQHSPKHLTAQLEDQNTFVVLNENTRVLSFGNWSLSML